VNCQKVRRLGIDVVGDRVSLTLEYLLPRQLKLRGGRRSDHLRMWLEQLPALRGGFTTTIRANMPAVLHPGAFTLAYSKAVPT
jgi:hypothetical protein